VKRWRVARLLCDDCDHPGDVAPEDAVDDEGVRRWLCSPRAGSRNGSTAGAPGARGGQRIEIVSALPPVALPVDASTGGTAAH
jgi:hypothetical protein